MGGALLRSVRYDGRNPIIGWAVVAGADLVRGKSPSVGDGNLFPDGLNSRANLALVDCRVRNVRHDEALHLLILLQLANSGARHL